MNKVNDTFNYCKRALIENKKILAGKNKSDLTVGIKNEIILSKGIFYSVLSSNKIELKYFLNELQKEDSNFTHIIVRELLENKKISQSEMIEISQIISNDNLDLFLILLEKYQEKESALKVLGKVYNSFKGNSKYLKTLGLLYLENNLIDEAVKLFQVLVVERKYSAATVFYLISGYLHQNRLEKIPEFILK